MKIILAIIKRTRDLCLALFIGSVISFFIDNNNLRSVLTLVAWNFPLTILFDVIIMKIERKEADND